MKSAALAVLLLAGCFPDAVDQYPVVPASNQPVFGQTRQAEPMAPDAATDIFDAGVGDGGVNPGFDAMPTAFDAGGTPTDVGSPAADAGVPPNP
jgi:hypothetical protein